MTTNAGSETSQTRGASLASLVCRNVRIRTNERFRRPGEKQKHRCVCEVKVTICHHELLAYLNIYHQQSPIACCNLLLAHFLLE